MTVGASTKKTASARGLFRATGKTSRPVAVYDLAGNIVKADALEREKDDFYPTPPEPIRAFLHAEIDRLRDFEMIWEASAGDGAIVRELEAVGLKVYASDLVDRGCGAEIRSFYDYDTPPSLASVQNPPFAECNTGDWVRHALRQLGLKYLALLLPLQWTGAESRAGLWAAFPPARVYIMRWRIDFTGQGAPPMLNAWYVWDVRSTGETVLRMLDRKDARQFELFAGGGDE